MVVIPYVAKLYKLFEFFLKTGKIGVFFTENRENQEVEKLGS